MKEFFTSLWGGTTACASWMRHQFAAFFASFWLYVILWTVVFGAFVVLLYIDGKFSRHLAEGAAIAPLSFQAMGWMYRLFAASFLMAAARCAYKGIEGKWTFRLLGVFASIIVCMHAFGFGFEALSDRRDQAMAAREIVAVKSESNDEVINALKERKATIDGDLERAVATLDAEITQYITDGKNNDYLADDARVRRNALQDEARLAKQDIDAQIINLMTASVTDRQEAVETAATAKPWAPLFIGIAQLVTWSKEPSDWAIYLCAIGFIIFWVLLGESLVIFLPERIYVMHLHDRQEQIDAKRSEAAKKGWETRKAKEEAKPEENIPVRDDGYWSERIRKALRTKMKNPTAEGMWNTYFPGLASVHELRGKLSVRLKRGQMTQDEFDFIMREGEYAPPPPKEYPVARQDDPEIEPDNEDEDEAPPVAAE